MKKLYICSAVFSVALLFSGLIPANPSGGDFEITKSTIDNGGGTSSGGDFSLTGTIGQHDASQTSSTGGGFQLSGGFWAANASNSGDDLFSDGFED